MPHPETSPGPAPAIRGQVPVPHERTEDELKLLLTEALLFHDHDTVAGNQFSRLAPSAKRANKVILRRGELGQPVLS